MNPQEKAVELIMKFKASESEDGYNDVRDLHSAIRCAKIAVDELLEVYADKYWIEVKQELEKL